VIRSPIGERRALDELHRQEHLARELSDLVHGHDVGVRELSHRACLAHQARLASQGLVVLGPE
jgi:hypothetical protein